MLNIYEQFISDIARSREMDLDKVRELADGRIYTGEQAKENGLIDELGSLQDAAEYLAKVGPYQPYTDGRIAQK